MINGYSDFTIFSCVSFEFLKKSVWIRWIVTGLLIVFYYRCGNCFMSFFIPDTGTPLFPSSPLFFFKHFGLSLRGLPIVLIFLKTPDLGFVELLFWYYIFYFVNFLLSYFYFLASTLFGLNLLLFHFLLS